MFVGNSFGCQVLAEFAVRHPQKTDRLVLQGPTVDDQARKLPVQVWRDLKNGCIEPGNVGRIVRIDYAKHTMNHAYAGEMAKAILPFLLADRGSLVRKAPA